MVSEVGLEITPVVSEVGWEITPVVSEVGFRSHRNKILMHLHSTIMTETMVLRFESIYN